MSIMIRMLLKQGADINAQNVAGMTALMESAIHGDVAKVKELLKRGAEVRLRDNGGRTACELAEKFGRHSVRNRRK
jgi:ankyrin repeat protein